MEKYGYVPNDELEKKSGVDNNKCPKCGAELSSTSPPVCPNCGSQPLEKKDGE